MVAIEKNQSKTNDLIAKITEHIEELAAATDGAYLSKQMQDYLNMCARFHRYSPHNVWLIMFCCPQATHVAGFHQWRKMGRFVRKGEKGIPILAPMLYSTEDENGERENHSGRFYSRAGVRAAANGAASQCVDDDKGCQ